MRARLAVLGAAVVLASGAMIAPASLADTPNTVTALVQPMAACESGRMGVLYCEGLLGAPVPISADPAANAPLWAATGYALCWTTASGTTLPAGASCSSSGTAIATGGNFSYPSAASFPVTFDGSGGSGCTAYPNNNQNSFFFFVNGPGLCVITVTAPAAAGYSATTTVFTLTADLAPMPTLNGTITAQSRSARVGSTAPLQTVTCSYDAQFSTFTSCPGVVLNWRVTEGARSCAISVNRNRESRYLDSVSVTLRRPGRCTVQATYPAIPGQSPPYTSAEYTYTVKRRA